MADWPGKNWNAYFIGCRNRLTGPKVGTVNCGVVKMRPMARLRYRINHWWLWRCWAGRALRARRDERRALMGALQAIASNTNEVAKQLKLVRQQMVYGKCQTEEPTTPRQQLAALDPSYGERLRQREEWRAEREKAGIENG